MLEPGWVGIGVESFFSPLPQGKGRCMIGSMYDVVVCRMTRRPGARLHREQGGNGGRETEPRMEVGGSLFAVHG